MKLTYAALTNVGRKRTQNQDRYLVQPEDHFFVVCDGMGGHFGGEIAAQTAVDTLSSFFAETRGQDDITWPYKGNRKLPEFENRLAVAVKWANFKVFEKSQTDAKIKGMGTTCVGIVIDGEQCAIGHVGDSRCYRVRNGTIEQMTEDHSLLNDYKKVAKLSPEEIKNFPHKNIIVRALGMKEHVQVDTHIEALQPGDLYLLCCDGLSGEVEDPDIQRIVNENRGNLDKTCEALVAQALEHGGRDNVTVVLVQAD